MTYSMREHNNRVRWLERKASDVQDILNIVNKSPVPSVSSMTQSTSHPGYFNDSTLCDLLVDVEACSTLEEGDGFPQVSLRHPHQCCYTLDKQRQSHIDYTCCTKKAVTVLCKTWSPKIFFMLQLYAWSVCRYILVKMKVGLSPSGRLVCCLVDMLLSLVLL